MGKKKQTKGQSTAMSKDCSQQPGVYNIHQLKVLEKIAQRKKDAEAKSKKKTRLPDVTKPSTSQSELSVTQKNLYPTSKKMSKEREKNIDKINSSGNVAKIRPNVKSQASTSILHSKNSTAQKNSCHLERRNKSRSPVKRSNSAQKRLNMLRTSLEKPPENKCQVSSPSFQNKSVPHLPTSPKLKNIVIPKKWVSSKPVGVSPVVLDHSTCENTTRQLAEKSQGENDGGKVVMIDDNGTKPTVKNSLSHNARHLTSKEINVPCLKRKRENVELSTGAKVVNSPVSNVSAKEIGQEKINTAHRRLHRLQTSLIEENESTPHEVTQVVTAGEFCKRQKVDKGLNNCVDSSHSTIDVDMEKCVDEPARQQKQCVNTFSNIQHEKMEWESVQFELQKIKALLTKSKIEHSLEVNQINSSVQNKLTMIVIDTNILLHNLTTIEGIVKGNHQHLRITIPWAVFQELDKLKIPNKQFSFSTTDIHARKAIRFLHTYLPNKKILGQSLSMAQNPLYKSNRADDEILNYCLQLSQYNVILLTNDINLVNKAWVNDITACTYQQFVDVYWPQIKDDPLSEMEVDSN